MYKRKTQGWAKHWDFMLLDCICLAVAFFWAHYIRHRGINPLQNDIYREIFLVSLLFNVCILLLLNTMKDVLKRGFYQELVATIRQSVVLLLCIVTFMYSVKVGDNYSRIAMYLMVVIYAVISYVTRVLWKLVLHKSAQSASTNALLILAEPTVAAELVQQISRQNFGQHKIVGIVTPEEVAPETAIEGIPVVASGDNIVEYVMKNWVDEVFIDGETGNVSEDTMEALGMMGVTLHLSLDRYKNLVGMKQVVNSVGEHTVLTSTMNYMTTRQYVAKRLLDIAGGLVGCLITGILYLILAPLIKKESPGPAFFTQERIGKNGKPFTMYKFRSMYLDAEARKDELLKQNRVQNDLMFKMEFDPRVIGNTIDENGKQKTGIGEFIRKYSLDEFPQFINVLKGDMSMVGTRPPLKREYEQYSAHHKARLATKPGITGLWQVSGRSNILDFEEVVKLDTQYITNWSVGLDLRILCKTVLVVLKKEGSM